MARKKKFDTTNSIKVLVTPWDKGFTCGIVMDSKAAMTTEQYELCSTIARGMIKMATSDPQTTFMYGLRGFAGVAISFSLCLWYNDIVLVTFHLFDVFKHLNLPKITPAN